MIVLPVEFIRVFFIGEQFWNTDSSALVPVDWRNLSTGLIYSKDCFVETLWAWPTAEAKVKSSYFPSRINFYFLGLKLRMAPDSCILPSLSPRLPDSHPVFSQE